jgi:hypothetical protein
MSAVSASISGLFSISLKSPVHEIQPLITFWPFTQFYLVATVKYIFEKSSSTGAMQLQPAID